MITQDQLPMVLVPSMNDTHLEDMLLINKLDKVSKEGNVKVIKEVLQELLDHTTIHFTDEEKLMKEARFPAFTEHKSEHDRHLHELKALMKYFDTNRDPGAIIAYVKGGLTPWMTHHVKTMDTEMAVFLKV
ncbi:hemerythrin family protein [Sulfurimonas sp.]|nr:hemerythrin family protein [Sulfurimonas sp.]